MSIRRKKIALSTLLKLQLQYCLMGIVKDILTNSASHPHGIKVRLTSGKVGRVKEVYS